VINFRGYFFLDPAPRHPAARERLDGLTNFFGQYIFRV